MFEKIKALLRYKAFKLFNRPYELNIVGLRSKSVVPNRFDDELHVFYKVSSVKWDYHVFKITTDPGTYWLKNPSMPQGTAILAEGQFIDSHAIGLHKGQYKALVQVNPLVVKRDYDRNAKLDFYNGKTEKGMFGINVHRANKVGTTKTVDRNSAGCQVFENAEDFATFLNLCEQHKSRYGNHFTYTLIDFRTVKKRQLRMMAYFLAALTTIGLAVKYYLNTKNTKTLNYG
jgi:hypothetical protein